MDTLSYMQNDADTPVVPLPNPGEGGPVPDGEAEGNFPVVPLPNPGEGGPIPDFDNGQTPVIPLPNPGEGGLFPTGRTMGSGDRLLPFSRDRSFPVTSAAPLSTASSGS